MLYDCLADAAIRRVKPGSKLVRPFDGRGLRLEVTPKGGKWWRLTYRFDGKQKLLSMSTFPDTNLKLARTKRDEARALLASGVDPSAAQKKAARTSRASGNPNGFEIVAT